MKKIFIFLMLSFGVWGFSQEFKLTEDNYRLKEDISKNYIVLEFSGKMKEDLFNLVKKNIVKQYSVSDNSYNDDGVGQINVEIISQTSRTIFINRKGANVWKVVNKYEINFKDGKVMVRPLFISFLNTENNGQATIGNFFNSRGIVRHENAVQFAEAFTNTFIKNFGKELIDNKDENW